jgi:hypothetical protein
MMEVGGVEERRGGIREDNEGQKPRVRLRKVGSGRTAFFFSG